MTVGLSAARDASGSSGPGRPVSIRIRQVGEDRATRREPVAGVERIGERLGSVLRDGERLRGKLHAEARLAGGVRSGEDIRRERERAVARVDGIALEGGPGQLRRVVLRRGGVLAVTAARRERHESQRDEDPPELELDH